MSLFDTPVAALGRYLEQRMPRHVGPDELPSWPEERTLLLQEDTALELGNPGVGSVAFLAWTARLPCLPGVHVVGPDLAELVDRSVALGRATIVAGRLDNEYERFLEIQDALYSAQLRDVTVRARPSQQSVWYRIGHAAVNDGFSLVHLGAALRRGLSRLDFVDEAAVVLVSAPDDELRQIARQAGRIVGALVKRNEEDVTECGVCEYSDICEEGREP